MKYSWVAGTGGIGKGEIFKLVGNATLGREESRSAILTDYRDYCKQHIILSYTARLVGKEIPVFACGKVGADERGATLKREMNEVGLNTDYVEESKDAPTMFSVCFLYENGEGGNITTCNDACSMVTEEELCQNLDKIISKLGNKGIVLGAPEVPLKARLGFMKKAKEQGCYTVCSVLAGEALEFIKSQGAKYCNLIAVNLDEANALGNGESCINVLRSQNSSIDVILTNGKKGCDVYFKDRVRHIDAIKATVISTAGAGDALLGGTIAGLASGMPLAEQENGSAVDLGVLCSSFAVESPHTIPVKFIISELLDRAERNGKNIKF